jgi:hypothetical protein
MTTPLLAKELESRGGGEGGEEEVMRRGENRF